MFWLLSLLMIVAALILILPRLLRPRPPTVADDTLTRQQNISAAREQMQALHAADETPQKMLSAEAQNEYETEIQSRLLEETSDQEKFAAELMQDTSNKTDDNSDNKSADWTGTWTAAIVLLIGAPLLYWFAGTPEVFNKPEKSAVSMESAIEGLRQHIKLNPEDDDAIILMGRGLSAMERHREAADYFSRARAIVGDLPSLLAANIYALLLSDGKGKAADALLKKSLLNHADSGEIQFLAGFRARTLGENAQAVKHLRLAITLLTDDAKAQKLAQQTLAEVEREMNGRTQ